MSGRLGRGAALAVAAAAAVLVALEPGYWKRYAVWLAHGGTPPASFYAPRETVAGAPAPAPPRVAPADENIDPAALEAAAEYAAARGSHALIVRRHGHLVFERYWHGGAFDTPVDAGAFGGTLTALLIGVALGERRIGSVDEPLSRYLEEWQSDPRGAITIRDLLQMSSGLRPAAAMHAPWTAGSREHLGTDIRSLHLERPLQHRPGQTWAEQGIDAQLLALIVERASGQRYARYLSDKLWKPLGAADAYLWLDRVGGTPHVHCCFVSSQGDWIRVAELLLNDGVYQGEEVLPPGWIRQMRTPARSNPRYGYQLWLAAAPRAEPGGTASEPYAADDVFFLAGSGGARLWLVPSLKLAVLRTGAPPEANWSEAHIPNLVIGGVADPARRALPAGATDPALYVPNH